MGTKTSRNPLYTDLFLLLYKLQFVTFCGKWKASEKSLKIQFFYSIVLLCFVVLTILYVFSLAYLNHLSLLTPVRCTENATVSTDCINGRNQTVQQLPNCIIIGVRKCGTRALLEFLDIHPQILKAMDEVHFFDDDQKYNLGLDWYRKQMPLSPESMVVIEKTPAYFITEYVPERIYAMNSSIKIILIVRDPVTRLISDYAQLASNQAKKDRRVRSFEEVVILPNGKINTNYKGIRISMFAVYFFRWIKLFTKSQIHVVDGDQFVYDPFPELQKIETFLGLSSYISRSHFTYNTTKGFYCMLTNDNEERCLNKNKGRKHPEINPVVIKKLRKFYEPYNKYFYKLVGRKFSWPDQ